MKKYTPFLLIICSFVSAYFVNIETGSFLDIWFLATSVTTGIIGVISLITLIRDGDCL